MYSVYTSKGQTFQIVETPPIRTISEMINDEQPGPYGMNILSPVEQHGVSIREIDKNLGQGYKSD